MSPLSKNEKLKILIVDDSEFNRQNMSAIFTDAGYNVIGLAATAEAAIEYATKSKPNIIFVDVVMPDITGIELTKHLYDKYSNDRFIVMMSSLDMDSIVIESIASGAVDFLKKPFDREDLLKMTQKIETLIR